MSIKGLAIDADVEQQNTDTLGGGFAKPTGLYGCVVDVAFLDKSKSGAMSLNLHLKLASDKSVIRQTIYMTSGDKKGNKNYYVKDGRKVVLPGMQLADQIAQITTGKAMGDLTAEKKMVKLWDPESRSEKPREVPTLPEMTGQSILIGLHKVDKNRWSGGAPTAQHTFVNEIDKVFYPDGYSTAEKAGESEEAVFHKQWSDKYGPDFVKDNYDPSVGGDAADPLAEAPATETDDLFSDAS